MSNSIKIKRVKKTEESKQTEQPKKAVGENRASNFLNAKKGKKSSFSGKASKDFSKKKV